MTEKMTDQDRKNGERRPDLTEALKRAAGERLKPKDAKNLVDPALHPTRGKGG